MTQVGAEVFADLLRCLAPYLDELVFVGGWVQALYVIEAEGPNARVVRTSDIDVTLGPTLDRGGRPALLDLLRDAGFEVEAFDDESGYSVEKHSVAVDLLAESPSAGSPVKIRGQPDLRVFGYPHQTLLRTNARVIQVGSDIHPSLETPIQILVPTLPAYVLGKLLSSVHRTNQSKRVKDLVYVAELMAHDELAERIIHGIAELAQSHAEEAEMGRRCLQSAIDDDRLLADIAAQIIESSGFHVAETPVRAQVKARLRRLLEEAGW